jgi:hypothetical protein
MTFARTSFIKENAQLKRWAFFLLYGLSTLGTAEAAGLLEKSQQMRLAESEAWKRLLHIEDPVGGLAESSVVDSEFFLSATDHKRVNPAKELRATIEAFNTPPMGNTNDHAQCKYPARKHWLLHQTGVPEEVLPAVVCPNLDAWAKLDKLQSASLMMVTGYFGNPASSFGHLMLKLNNGDTPDVKSLLDDGINYGAAVPDNEPMLVYILRGLFGGYRAACSNKPFYNTDQVYTRTEFRDMWEYELDFSDYQLKLFVYHLWELVEAGFVYYFLDKNCAYRLAELLELVTGYRFTPRAQPWYIPITTFKRLNELQQRHGGLIRSVKLQPSLQREAYALASSLPKRLLARVNDYIKYANSGTLPEFYDLSRSEQVEVVDTLLKYYNYKLVAAEESRGQALTDAKTELLKRRFKLPDGQYQPLLSYPRLYDPSKLSGPNRFQVGAARSRSADDLITMRYAPYHQDLLMRGNSENLAFTAVDIGVSLSKDSRLRLDHLTLADITKIRAEPAPYRDEARSSWRVSIESARNRDDDMVTTAEVGIGLASQLAPNVVIYGFADGYVQSEQEPVGAAISLGGLYTFFDDALKLQTEWQYRPHSNYASIRWSAKMRYSFSSKHELRAEAENVDGSMYRLAWNYRW